MWWRRGHGAGVEWTGVKWEREAEKRKVYQISVVAAAS